LWFRHAFYINQAHAACGHWIKEWVITKTRDFNTQEFRGSNGEGPFGYLKCYPIDDDSNDLNGRDI
jgi:hypothetical protein